MRPYIKTHQVLRIVRLYFHLLSLGWNKKKANKALVDLTDRATKGEKQLGSTTLAYYLGLYKAKFGETIAEGTKVWPIKNLDSLLNKKLRNGIVYQVQGHNGTEYYKNGKKIVNIN